VNYEARRDLYLAHVQACTSCISSFTGRRKFFLDNAGNLLNQRYHTVSEFCPEARRLLDAMVA